MTRSVFTPFARAAAVVMVGFAALLLPSATAGATASPGWATATNLTSPPYGTMESISCWSAGNCVAVGAQVNGNWESLSGTIATEVDGTWGAPVKVANTYQFFTVSCLDASHCVAAGQELYGNSMRPTIVVKTPDGWQAARRLTGTGTSGAYPFGVSCVDATNCIVVGTTGDGHVGYFSEVDGTWDTGMTAASPWGQLNSVSCLPSGTCTAVGEHSVWTGTTTSLTLLTTLNVADSYELRSVSCLDASHCTAVGSGGYRASPLVASTSDGSTWSITDLPGDYEPWSPKSVALSGVSCTSATKCVAVGTKGSPYDEAGTTAISFVESDGSWGDIMTIGQPNSGSSWMSSISCGSSSTCGAVGQSGDYGTVATYTGATQSTPSTPSITDLPAAFGYGGSFVPTVTTSGDGNSTVTSSTPGVCSVDGSGVVHLVALGLCTLVAHVEASASYLAADGVGQSVIVKPTAPAFSAKAKVASATATWRRPTTPSGAITAYAAVARDGSGAIVSACYGTRADRRCTITGLSTGVSYGVSVFAVERITVGRKQFATVVSAENPPVSVVVR